MSKLTQLDRAVIVVDGLRGMRDELQYAHAELDTVLDEAQNPAPAGAADGTISAENWRELCAIYVGLTQLLDAIAKATE